MKKIIPIDIIKGFSDKFCGSNSKENFATNKCSSAYFTFHSPFILRSFSVRSPFILRSFSVRSPFVLRSFSVRSPFVLRSSSVDPPLILRSFSVRAPFGDRRMIEETSENHRRQDGDVSKL